MSLTNVKNALLVFVRDILVTRESTKYDNTKTFWSDVYDERPEMPYCYLNELTEESLGEAIEVSFTNVSTGNVTKTEMERFQMTVGINTVSDKANYGSALLAKNVAHESLRLVRSKFKSDYGLNYFISDNEYFTPIYTIETSGIRYIPDFEDTTTKFRFNFDVTIGWNESTDTTLTDASGLAQGAKIDLNDEEEIIDINK